MRATIDRRVFLKATGALVVTFALAPLPGGAKPPRVRKPLDLDHVDSFVVRNYSVPRWMSMQARVAS
jgi:hypothetical protein